MKHLICLPLAALLCLFTACITATPDLPTPPDTSEAVTEAPTAPPSSEEERIRELEDALLTLKSQSYVQAAEYEARIRELEAELARLKAQLREDPLTDPTDIPVSGNLDPAPTLPFLCTIDNGRVTILRYTGNATAVNIPRDVEGYPVTAIGEAAFRGTAVTSVILPDTVTDLGWFAFADCQSLQSVTLPASVESIGYGAFDACPNLTLYCPASSYAAQYAASFALRYDLT